MLTMELRKSSPNQTTEHLSTPLNRSYKDILDHHLKRNIFQVGDRVVFKRPKRNKVYGTISEIETDPEKVTWTKGKTVPNYISVTVETVSKTNGRMLVPAKTYESKILKVRSPV